MHTTESTELTIRELSPTISWTLGLSAYQEKTRDLASVWTSPHLRIALNNTY
ncbi:hypothetical protein BDZ89DRAFT_1059012 [Hymenopellis radicata]|nr:hypothetical protein BDZ89DRAFT_1059012 [Hymenopellis radicata]